MTNGVYRRENLEAFYEGYRSAYDNGFLAYDTLYGIAYTWVEWLAYNIRRALGLEGCSEEERQLGEREVRNTVARIKALGDAEEEICGTLRELRVREMEGVFDKAVALMKTVEDATKAKTTRTAKKRRQELQVVIDKLEAYYESPLWKADFAADEDGRFPAGMKRGVLSEDGVYDLLEQYGGLEVM